MIVQRVIVTGGREWTDSMWIESDLRALQRLGLRRVAQGRARGADRIAEQAWRVVCDDIWPHSEAGYVVDVQLDGPWPNAGNVRNRRMIDKEFELAHLAGERLIVGAYPDPNSRGTWNCVADALRSGLPVFVATPDDARRAAIRSLWERLDAESERFTLEPLVGPGLTVLSPRGSAYSYGELASIFRALQETPT